MLKIVFWFSYSVYFEAKQSELYSADRLHINPEIKIILQY